MNGKIKRMKKVIKKIEDIDLDMAGDPYNRILITATPVRREKTKKKLWLKQKWMKYDPKNK